MNDKKLPDTQEAIELSHQILKELDKKKIDPVVAYAALGSALLQLHRGLGRGKKAWIKLTAEMAEYFPE